MISSRFNSSFCFNHTILLYFICLSVISSSVLCKCTDGHSKPVRFTKSNGDSSQRIPTVSKEKKINLFHRPIKSSMMVDERTYRLVEDEESKQHTLNASQEDTLRIDDKKLSDVNRTHEINSTVMRRQTNDPNVFIQDNRLIEESSEQSSSVDLPEEILIKMSTMNEKDFFDSYVEEEDDDNPNIVIGHLEDDEQETHSEDDISVSMLMRGANTDSEASAGSATPRKKVPQFGHPQKTCTLEFKNVELPRPEDIVLYYPMCVRIARCSGCCMSSRLKCTPTNITEQSIEVTLLKYNADRKKLIVTGIETYKFEKHEDCSCQCIQQASDCNQHQMYIPHECRCACRDSSKARECAADSKKMWQSDQCNCICKHRSSCTTGTIFNEDTCKCEIKKSPSIFSALGLNDFGSIRISHSTYDIELKKQQDFPMQSGAHDGGINTDDSRSRKISFT